MICFNFFQSSLFQFEQHFISKLFRFPFLCLDGQSLFCQLTDGFHYGGGIRPRFIEKKRVYIIRVDVYKRQVFSFLMGFLG